ncbi:MAG: M23 family metallopeptidase, partial [Gammaproteobacteria bacterium]|nr:M23 family metallopeptidase [Gammaproteobacteria bacterium]
RKFIFICSVSVLLAAGGCGGGSETPAPENPGTGNPGGGNPDPLPDPGPDPGPEPDPLPDPGIGVWPINKSTTPDCTQDGFAHRTLGGDDDLHPGWDTCDDNMFDLDAIAGNDNDDHPDNTGLPIHVPLDGKVTRVRLWTFDDDPATPDCPNFCRQGNYIMIRHPQVEAKFGGQIVQTIYMHMADGSVTVSEGDDVKQGDQIGLVDNTGDNINTKHLHFGLLVGPAEGTIDADKYINPLAILPYTQAEPRGVALTRLADTSFYDVGECIATNTLRLSLTQAEPAIDVTRIEVEPQGEAPLIIDMNERINIGTGSSADRDDFEQGCVAVEVDDFNESSTHYVLRAHFGGDFSALDNYTIRMKSVRDEIETRACSITTPDGTPTDCP